MALESPNSKGFTLIELVVVIVILGILSVTAAPKFINLAKDAKGADLQAIGGAMKSGLKLIYSQAFIENQHIGEGIIQVNNVEIPLYNGYPAVDGGDGFPEINAQLKAWLELDVTDRNTADNNRDAATFFSDKSSANNQIYIFFTADFEQKSVNFKCQIRYQNPIVTAPEIPEVKIETSAC